MVPIPDLQSSAIVFYVGLGAVIGILSVLITRAVYAVEDLFEKLPVHWMWWPAIGGLAVGVIGYFYPHTMGVGYDNIEHILRAEIGPETLAIFILMKFISWSVALGSGTSGGTLAPIFTIGGGVGLLLGLMGKAYLPDWGIDPTVCALVGMAGTFAGASRALLASVVFAFETTQQPLGLLPLLAGGTASYLIASYLMRNSIMTEKIVRRGVNVPAEYQPDRLDHVHVADYHSHGAVTLLAGETVAAVMAKLNSSAPEYSHQGFPILDNRGKLMGMVTRRDLLAASQTPDLGIEQLIKRPPITVRAEITLRDAADVMAANDIGRLIVVDDAGILLGIVTRSDLLRAHRQISKHRAHPHA
jgi:CIC family chloride channel protein